MKKIISLITSVFLLMLFTNTVFSAGDEENLNLLSTTDLINLLNNFGTIQYEIRYLNFLGFKSNCIIFGKIINSAERSKWKNF